MGQNNKFSFELFDLGLKVWLSIADLRPAPSLITGTGEGGAATKSEGGASEVLPLQKKGGGEEKV